MTTLHEIPANPVCLCHWPEPEERVTMPSCPIHPMPPAPEPPPYRCPNEECENRDDGRWWRGENGTYTETHIVTFRPAGLWDEDWENNETDMHEADGWKCWWCDTPATTDIAEWIDDNR